MRIVNLFEMAAKKICPLCGKSMTGNHYWYKGGWKCKGGAGAHTPSPGPTGTVAPTVQPTQQPNPSAAATNQDTKKTYPQSAAPTGPSAPPQSVQLPAEVVQKRITDWLKKHMNVQPNNITFTADHKVSVSGNVFAAASMRWERLPIPFAEVTGNFESLAGHLTSMFNFPSKVGGDLNIAGNEIPNLEGLPPDIGGSIDLSHNPITSLDGIQPNIDGDLIISSTHIKSLRGINKLIKSINGAFIAGGVKLEEGGLGLLQIKNLERITLDPSLKKVEDILNKHLKGDRDILVCQEELIDAGFSQYARI